jgi:hypothetical protein
MSLPSQPLSSEEPEQQLTLPSSIEETPTELSTTSDSLPENIEQQPAYTASEDMPTQPEAPSTPDENLISTPDEGDKDEDDEDEDDENQKGIFIQRRWLIASACVVVIAALLVTFLLLVNRPQDPPTDWIASYTPPAGSSSATKILYYLHWTNQNSDLKGQLHLAANSNGTPQSLTVPMVGLYNKENHIIYVVITINGQPDTLTGTINDKNDVLILDQVNAPNQENQLVFHTGSANDYQQATKRLNSGTK